MGLDISPILAIMYFKRGRNFCVRLAGLFIVLDIPGRHENQCSYVITSSHISIHSHQMLRIYFSSLQLLPISPSITYSFEICKSRTKLVRRIYKPIGPPKPHKDPEQRLAISVRWVVWNRKRHTPPRAPSPLIPKAARKAPHRLTLEFL